MHYQSGQKIKVNDSVHVKDGGNGKIVANFELREFSDAYPLQDWGSYTKGVLIEMSNGALVRIERLIVPQDPEPMIEKID